MKLLFTITVMLLISSVTTFGQNVTGSGQASYITKFTGTGTSSTVASSTLIYDNGTGIGIGTTSSTAKLSIEATSGNENIRISSVIGSLTTRNGSSSNFDYPALSYHAYKDGILQGTTGEISFMDRPGTYTYTSAVRTSDILFKTAHNWNGVLLGQYLDVSMVIKATQDGGYVGIGTPAPQAKLDVNGNIYCNSKLFIGIPDANTTTKIASYALAVNGDAIFNKAKVKLYGTWPDYVFDDIYNLTPLADLEKFIKQNKHLPDVPSATDVEKEGIDLGDIQSKLLKKVEELTLYMIEQNKKIDEQSAEINILKTQVKLSQQ